MDSIYLDIETRSFPGRMHYIPEVGFYHEETGLVQMLWPEITVETLDEALPEAERIYTFNGNNFDLKVITQFHGINLLDRYKSRDLMYDCWKHHGDEGALMTLLKYNEEDVMNLIHLRERLSIPWQQRLCFLIRS